MKYSIIIPTLNEEKLLPVLLNQLSKADVKTKFNAEIIISDGGSTDRTVEIALAHADKIIVHREEVKQNIAMGRNAGADNASGEILIFLGADIRFKNVADFFNTLENTFLFSRYLALTCNVKIAPDEEILTDRIFHSVLNTYFYLLNVIGVGMGRGECQIVRREVFRNVHGYNEELAAGEDFDLFKRIRKSGEILYLRDQCVYESPRRYRKYGYLHVCRLWAINAFYVIFKNKSLADEWEQIR